MTGRILALIALLLVCAGCTRLGSITGRWKAPDGNTYEFKNDGTYTADMEVTLNGRTARSRVEGTHRMSGNQLDLHVIKTFSASGTKPLEEKKLGDWMPKEWRYTVRSLDERELVLVDEYEQEHKFKRQP